MKLISDNPEVNGVVLTKGRRLNHRIIFTVQELHQFLKIVKEEETLQKVYFIELLAYSGVEKGNCIH